MALQKYRFLEDFPMEEGTESVAPDSPKMVSTKNFGERELHQIAKCIYIEKEDDGQKWLIVKMGEKGGWIEKYSNLSQDGECWVKPNGIVCMDANVSGSAIVESGEIGDYAKLMDDAVLKGDAVIRERATVFGDSEVSGTSIIEGSARVNAEVKRASLIGGSAIVFSYRKQVENMSAETLYPSKDAKGFLEGVDLKATVEDSVIDGRSQVRGVFNIINSEIHDNTIVYGTANALFKHRGEIIIKYDALVKDAKISGSSFVTGEVFGPIELEDCMLKKTVGTYNRDELAKYLLARSRMDSDYRKMCHYLENYGI